jgi:flagellar assembly factor FliW
VTKLSEIKLKGKIIGFEEFENYIMEDKFGEESLFRLLVCLDEQISFVVVNPYSIVDDYTFDIDDDVLKSLHFDNNTTEGVVVLCIVRPNQNNLLVNLRSPLVINPGEGIFRQIILQNESYGVSVPLEMNKTEE